MNVQAVRTRPRAPVALEQVADGWPFGQVAEALVTAGGDRW